MPIDALGRREWNKNHEIGRRPFSLSLSEGRRFLRGVIMHYDMVWYGAVWYGMIHVLLQSLSSSTGFVQLLRLRDKNGNNKQAAALSFLFFRLPET